MADDWLFDVGELLYEQVEHPLAEVVKDAVEGLGYPLRDIVEMVVWGRMSYADVGRELGWTRQHVRRRYQVALARLREELAVKVDEYYGGTHEEVG